MKKIYVLLIQLSVFYCNSFYAQSLKESIQELDNYFMQVMEDWRIPNMAIGVVEGDKIVFLKGYGYRDVDKKIPVDENTLFPIDGIDLTFLDASIGILQHQGKIDLDEPIKHYLPDFSLYDPYVSNHVTIRDLMTAKTGLPNHGFLWYGTDYSREQVMNVLKFLDPVKGFRESSRTTLTPYMLKYTVDHVSDLSYENFMKRYLLTPLDMNNTCFGFEFEKKDNIALPYEYDPEGKKYELSLDSFKELLSIYNAHNNAGIFSSAKEICNWMIMNLNGGYFKGKQIISADFISNSQSLITPNGYSDYQQGNINLGWGYSSEIDYFHGHHLVSSYGHKGVFDSRLMLFPRDSIGIIVLTGSTFSGRWIIAEVLAEKIILGEHSDWNLIGLNKPLWAKEMEERPNPDRPVGLNTADLPSLKLQAYAGKYRNNGYGEIIVWEESGLLKGKRSKTIYELDHIGKDTFKIHVPNTFLSFKTMQFHVDDKGNVNNLSVDFESQLPPIEFIRVE